MLDMLCINPNNILGDRTPSFFPEPHPAAFLLPPENQMDIEHIEYDLLLEQAERRELTDFPPHLENAAPLHDEDWVVVPGCYISQPVKVDY